MASQEFFKENGESALKNTVDENTGYYGINNTDPTAQLDINGTLRVRDFENENLIRNTKTSDITPLVVDNNGNVFGAGDTNNMNVNCTRIPKMMTGSFTTIKGQTVTTENIFRDYSTNNLKNIKLFIHSPSTQEFDSIDFNHVGKKIFALNRSWSDPKVIYENEHYISCKTMQIWFDYSKGHNNVDLKIKNTFVHDIMNFKYFITFYKYFD